MKTAIIELPSTTGDFRIQEQNYTSAKIVAAKDKTGKKVDKVALFMGNDIIYINGVKPHKLLELLHLLKTENNPVIDLNYYKRHTELTTYQQKQIILHSGRTIQEHISYVINYFLTNIQDDISMIDKFNLILEKYAFKIIPKQNVLALINNHYLCIPNPEQVAEVWSKTLYFPYSQHPEVLPVIFFETLINKYNNQK